MSVETRNAEPSAGPAREAVILCVDDEPGILSVLRRVLRRIPGYKIVVAESGQAGLDALEECPADLVISDMRMPQMDGVTFLKKVAERWPETVRILLTGQASLQSTVDVVNEAGIFRYLHKPWDEPELRLAVSEALEMRWAELDRRQALEAAWAANRAREEFLANISHELKTPLHAVLSCCRISEKALAQGNTKMLGDSIGRIHKNGEVLLQLVTELLDLSKLEANAVAISRETVQVRALVSECVEELSALAAEKTLSVNHHVPEDIHAMVDPTQFPKVVRNIVGNAIKFAPLNGHVDIACKLEGKRFVINVRDDGPGVPPDELGLIFEKFLQSSLTNSGAGGTGLGLAITKGIVAAHGGSVRATNRSPNGLDVEISVPRAVETSVAA